MRKRQVSLSIAVLSSLVTAYTAKADLVGSDNFSYPLGALTGQTGGTGWEWGENPANTPSNWYTVYGTDPQVTANGVFTSGNAVARYFGAGGNASSFQASGTVYFGVTLTFNSAADASSTDYSDISALDYGTERIQFGRSYGYTDYGIGITSNPTGSTGPANGTVIDSGISTSRFPSVRLVGSVQYDSNPNDDNPNGVLKLWVNPNTSDFDTNLGSINYGNNRNTSAEAVLNYGNTNYWTNGVRLASGSSANSTWSNLVVSTDFATAAGSNLPAAKAINIMPLGDSITWGQGVAGGYETKLYTELAASGLHAKFLGSQTNNASTTLSNNNQIREEGHPGAFTDYILGNLDGNVNGDVYDNGSGPNLNNGGDWLTTNSTGTPDYVLLMIGTNDVGFGGGAAHALTNLGLIMDKITSLDPNAHIIVSNALSRTDSSTANTNINTQYNPNIPGLVSTHASEGEKVSFVDINSLFNTSTMLQSDGVHPNALGYSVVGDAFANAIAAINASLSPSSVTGTWIQASSGNWAQYNDWSSNSVPNGIGAEADLYSAINASASISTDSPVTLGTLRFNNSHTYAVSGAGSLTLQTSTGSALVDVQAGTQKISVPLTIASNATFNVASGATLVVANPLTINSGKSLSQTGTGTVTYQSTITLQSGATLAVAGPVNANSLSLAASAQASIANHGAGPNNTLQLQTLSISGGKLDLSNNDMVLHSSSVSAVTTQLQNGYGTGSWNGTSGIVSTAAAGSSLTTLGVATGLTSFDGQSVSTSDVEVKYTFYGDANLSGHVDGSDYTLIDTGFGSHGSLTGWQNGDFNYDGHIDGSDYSLIDNAFNTQTATPQSLIAGQVAANSSEIAAGSAVPEPASIGLVGVAALGLTARRHRKVARRA
jgi:lysophospholipase L1-like esterase